MVRLEPSQGSPPEDLPRHGGVQEEGPLGGGQGVQPRADDAPDARGQVGRLGRCPLGEGGRELLDEQRVPLGGRGQHGRALRRLAQGVVGEEAPGKVGRLPLGQRREGKGGVGREPTGPGSPGLEQLRPSQGEQE